MNKENREANPYYKIGKSPSVSLINFYRGASFVLEASRFADPIVNYIISLDTRKPGFVASKNQCNCRGPACALRQHEHLLLYLWQCVSNQDSLIIQLNRLVLSTIWMGIMTKGTFSIKLGLVLTLIIQGVHCQVPIHICLPFKRFNIFNSNCISLDNYFVRTWEN